MDVNDHKFQGFASKEMLIVAPCFCGKKKKNHTEVLLYDKLYPCIFRHFRK